MVVCTKSFARAIYCTDSILFTTRSGAEIVKGLEFKCCKVFFYFYEVCSYELVWLLDKALSIASFACSFTWIGQTYYGQYYPILEKQCLTQFYLNLDLTSSLH